MNTRKNIYKPKSILHNTILDRKTNAEKLIFDKPKLE